MQQKVKTTISHSGATLQYSEDKTGWHNDGMKDEPKDRKWELLLLLVDTPSTYWNGSYFARTIGRPT